MSFSLSLDRSLYIRSIYIRPCNSHHYWIYFSPPASTGYEPWARAHCILHQKPSIANHARICQSCRHQCQFRLSRLSRFKLLHSLYGGPHQVSNACKRQMKLADLEETVLSVNGRSRTQKAPRRKGQGARSERSNLRCMGDGRSWSHGENGSDGQRDCLWQDRRIQDSTRGLQRTRPTLRQSIANLHCQCTSSGKREVAGITRYSWWSSTILTQIDLCSYV